MNKIKIILVDDHEIVRNGIKSLLILNNEINIIGEASDGEELFNILKTAKPDIIILDIEMPGLSGLEIAAILDESHPEIKKILLSANINEENIRLAVEAGVLGILPKNCSHKDLIQAIESSIRGEAYYNNFVTDLLIKNYLNRNTISKKFSSQTTELSHREIEVIKCFADGMIYKEIADKLNISPRTVESHKVNILSKLQLNSIIDIVKYAIKNNLVEI